MTPAEERRKAIIVWIGRRFDEGAVEPQIAAMVPDLGTRFGEDWNTVRQRTLQLAIDGLLVPFFPHERVYSKLSIEEAIARDRNYMAQLMVGARLTESGRRLYTHYTASALSRLFAWFQVRQIIVGIVIGAVAAIAAALVLRTFVAPVP